MTTLPSYYHLSPSQIHQLSFHVRIRCIRRENYFDQSGSSGISVDNSDRPVHEAFIARDIAWQEEIKCLSSVNSTGIKECTNQNDIFLYTKIHAHYTHMRCTETFQAKLFDLLHYRRKNDELSLEDTGESHESSSSRSNQYGLDARKRHSPESCNRWNREDPSEIMLIMAAVCNRNRKDASPKEHYNVVLCNIEVHQSGLVSAYPAWSTVEAEDCDDNHIFTSDRSINEILLNGQRLTTYTFTTPDGSVFEYTIEWNEDRNRGSKIELSIAEKSRFDIEAIKERQYLVRKELESTGCLLEAVCDWNYQAYVEIVSATSVLRPNLLLSLPFGSNLKIRYKLLTLNRSTQRYQIALQGRTNSIHTFPLMSSCVEFVVHFTIASLAIPCASLLSTQPSGDKFWRPILSFFFLLILFLMHFGTSSVKYYHLNHLFSFMFNDSLALHSRKKGDVILDLYAYYEHNFGVTSLAGSGSVILPSKEKCFELEVTIWKGTAFSPSGGARSRMHDYYLGGCIDDINSSGLPIQLHRDHVEGRKVDLLSRGGLQTERSGSILLRVQIAKNYISREIDVQRNIQWEKDTCPRGNRIRENAEEVLTRVRRNKRGRMIRAHNLEATAHRIKLVEESNSTETKVRLPERTAQVLERVKARQSSTSSYMGNS